MEWDRSRGRILLGGLRAESTFLSWSSFSALKVTTVTRHRSLWQPIFLLLLVVYPFWIPSKVPKKLDDCEAEEERAWFKASGKESVDRSVTTKWTLSDLRLKLDPVRATRSSFIYTPPLLRPSRQCF